MGIPVLSAGPSSPTFAPDFESFGAGSSSQADLNIQPRHLCLDLLPRMEGEIEVLRTRTAALEQAVEKNATSLEAEAATLKGELGSLFVDVGDARSEMRRVKRVVSDLQADQEALRHDVAAVQGETGAIWTAVARLYEHLGIELVRGHDVDAPATDSGDDSESNGHREESRGTPSPAEVHENNDGPGGEASPSGQDDRPGMILRRHLLHAITLTPSILR